MERLKHGLIVLSTSAAGMILLAFFAATFVSSTTDHAQAAVRRPLAILRPAPVDPIPVPLILTPPTATAPSASEAREPAAKLECPPAAPVESRAGSVRPESFIGVLLPEHAADVSAQQAGLVRAMHATLGQVVESGQVLVSLAVEQASLDHTRAVAEREAARAALARARIESAHAASEAERSDRLAQEGLTTHEERSRAHFELDQSQVLTAEAEAHLRERSARADQLAALRDQGRVVASFRGRVAARYVSPGTLVAAGTPLLRLISDDKVLLRFAVPEHVTGLQVKSRVTLVPNEHAELRFAADVVRVSPEIDAASRMRTVEATPSDPKTLVARGLIGSIVSVHLDAPQPGPGALLTANRGASP